MNNMRLTRRKKFAGQGYNVVQDESKVNLIDVNFDLTSLNLMCYYILSENLSIKRSQLINLRNLFEIIDMNIYQSDPEKLKRIRFIKKGLEARLEKGIKNPHVISKYIADGFMGEDFVDIRYEDCILSNEELEWVNGTVSETLKYSFIYNRVDGFIDLLTRFKSSNYLSKGAIVKEIEEMVDILKADFRRVSSYSMYDRVFTLKDGLFENVIIDTHDELNAPSNRILCGMQGMNEMTYGGFQSTRCYMYFACPGTGKSMLAANLLIQMKKANKDVKPKDPTKRPAVVLLTMENMITETVERIFDIVLDVKDELKNYSPEEVINMLRTEGELCLTDESPVDIIVKFVPNQSVDTGYFYTLVEELEDEGVETIAFIFDYLNCIRAVQRSSDLRIEYGNIVSEMKTFATLKNIPIISFGQLNRDATAKVDAARMNNMQDIARVLGRAQIAESILILNNIDWGCIIDVEYDSKGEKYMTFNRFKMRGKSTPRYYMCQPFRDKGSICLVDDMGEPLPLLKDTLKDDIANKGLNMNSRLNTRIEENLNDESISLPLHDKLHNGDNIYLLSKFRSKGIITPQVQEEPQDMYGNPSMYPEQPLFGPNGQQMVIPAYISREVVNY